MTRKFLDAVRAEINTLVADNTSGDISPADVRTCLLDITDSTVNSTAWYASSTPSLAVPLTTTGTIPPAPVPQSGQEDPTLITVSTGTRQFTVQAAAVGFSVEIFCLVTMSSANNNKVSLDLYVNGAIQIFGAEVVNTGPTDPSTISFAAYINAAVAGTLDMRLRTLTGAFNVDVLNSAMSASILPSNN